MQRYLQRRAQHLQRDGAGPAGSQLQPEQATDAPMGRQPAVLARAQPSEADGLRECEKYFVDNVLYYDGTMPVRPPDNTIRVLTNLGWDTSGKQVQELIERATSEAIAYRIPNIEDESPAAALGYLAPCRLTGPGKRQ